MNRRTLAYIMDSQIPWIPGKLAVDPWERGLTPLLDVEGVVEYVDLKILEAMEKKNDSR